MCRKMQSMQIFRITKAVDPKAFISQWNVNGVYGEGFDEMKVRLKHKDAQAAIAEKENASQEPSEP